MWMLSLQNIVRTFFVLFLLSVAWHYRLPITDLVRTDDSPAKPIVFDNGTVREQAAASAPEPASSQAAIPHGDLRRCTRGSDVSYTNATCPTGYKERAMSTDRFNVVSGK